MRDTLTLALIRAEICRAEINRRATPHEVQHCHAALRPNAAECGAATDPNLGTAPRTLGVPASD